MLINLIHSNNDYKARSCAYFRRIPSVTKRSPQNTSPQGKSDWRRSPGEPLVRPKMGASMFWGEFSGYLPIGCWMERTRCEAEQRKGNTTFAFLVVSLSATSLMIAVYIDFIYKQNWNYSFCKYSLCICKLDDAVTHVRWSHKIQHLILNFCCHAWV